MQYDFIATFGIGHESTGESLVGKYLPLQYLSTVKFLVRWQHSKNKTSFDNKTPAMHRGIFALKLANNRHLIETSPPPR